MNSGDIPHNPNLQALTEADLVAVNMGKLLAQLTGDPKHLGRIIDDPQSEKPDSPLKEPHTREQHIGDFERGDRRYE